MKQIIGSNQEKCPYCTGKKIVKRGKREKKFEIVQLWFCKDCQKTFTPQLVKGKSFPLKVILDGLSYYNTGFSLKESCSFLKHQYGLNVQPPTLFSWVEEYKEICRYSRMRKFGKKLFNPNKIIVSTNLYHRQVYRFRIHRAKLAMVLEEDFRHYKLSDIVPALESLYSDCPHYLFQEGMRASQIKSKFSLDQVIIREKNNYANKIANLVTQSVTNNRHRHDALQKFMLANDSVTVATEVPIYLLPEDVKHMESKLKFEIPVKIDKVLTGHIDLIQLRNGAIHILDYKPNASKTKPIEQLTLYALAMSRLTGLRLFNFKCAWFDEKQYFEFFPLHVVYKLRKKGYKAPENQLKLIETRKPIK